MNSFSAAVSRKLQISKFQGQIKDKTPSKSKAWEGGSVHGVGAAVTCRAPWGEVWGTGSGDTSLYRTARSFTQPAAQQTAPSPRDVFAVDFPASQGWAGGDLRVARVAGRGSARAPGRGGGEGGGAGRAGGAPGPPFGWLPAGADGPGSF